MESKCFFVERLLRPHKVDSSNGKQKHKKGLVDTLCALPKLHIYLWLLLGHMRHIEISGIIFIANIHTQSQSVDLPLELQLVSQQQPSNSTSSLSSNPTLNF